ncbi:hypothetical protein ATCC51562_1320 [Campylobacter concisus ATCC 51562]|uniref:Uncharacterized protein n=1 Tax=Campylobacter concisus ATCC 51562 TaxID=1242969 RepID=U2GC87_9BACT|nr:hypothetical protein ATCC51562_1320 [Campylobacter concisus ATCC 51562]
MINEDTSKIATLSENFSEDMFTSLASAQEAQALIGGAIELLKNKSSHIQNELIKLQKAQKYVTN